MNTNSQHHATGNWVILDSFLAHVQAVNEVDYGDCMREWNKDLLELKEHLYDPSGQVRKKIEDMQGYIQFNPNWDVDSTKLLILEDVKQLRQMLRFHSGDC